MEKVDFIESFGKLEVKEGDIIILKSPESLSPRVFSGLKDQLKMLTDKLNLKNVQVAILDNGMDIGILRKYQEEDVS